jgi:hypothetical protein
MKFRWTEWNVDKCHMHGVQPEEAEEAIQNARRPYPRKIEDGKTIVRGQSTSGRYLQVIYLVDDDGTVFVIHAMPLAGKKKRNYRRSQK